MGNLQLVAFDFLMAGQALSCFFKLKNYRKWVDVEDNPSSLVPLETADIRLVRGDGEALFDISRSPLVDFHYHESAHQEKSDQDCQIEVDFILIFGSRSDDTSGINLFSSYM